MLDALRPGGADNVRLLVLLSSVVIAFLTLHARQARAAEPDCEAKVMHLVAHEDDDLLFQSPRLLEAVESGECVRTVYVTAGDAGLGTTYWQEREVGSRAAYAEMAGVADAWSESKPVVAGHTVTLHALDEEPQVSQVNLRLPDGGPTGNGYEATGFQSVPKLWRSEHTEPAGLESIESIEAVDGSATYSYEGLLATLEALIAEFGPNTISTQNFSAEFGYGDHFDHIAIARFARLASDAYGAEHALRAFLDYESKLQEANVFEPQLQSKLDAYYAYAVHDSAEACASQAECEEPAYVNSYWLWLHRQYVASASSVPGADAGPPQSVTSEAAAALDGSASSDPLSKLLSYEWTQTSGPAVTLSDPTAAEPTFTAPTGPAALAFSLVVDNGEAASLPATTAVTVAALPEEPVTPTPPSLPPIEPIEPGQRPRIPGTTIEVVAGRVSKQVIRVTGAPIPQSTCEGHLPAALVCHVRRNGEVAIRSGRRVAPTGAYRARITARNSAGTARRAVTVLVRPDPRAPLSIDLAAPAT